MKYILVLLIGFCFGMLLGMELIQYKSFGEPFFPLLRCKQISAGLDGPGTYGYVCTNNPTLKLTD